MSKPAKTLGELLQSATKTCEPRGPKNKMQNVAKKFLTNREVSAQELAYRLLSLPMSKTSRSVLFIPTDLPENRIKLLKPVKVIKELNDEEGDIYQKGIIEKYKLRPESVNDLCLAVFASRYRLSKPKTTNSVDLDILNEVELDNIANQGESQQDLPKTITLSDIKQSVSLRKVQAIIRTYQYSRTKQPEELYHSKLMLYLPWRNEYQDLRAEDNKYQTKFSEVVSQIKEKYEEYEPKADEFLAAATAYEQNGPLEDAWATLAPQVEQERHEDQGDERPDDPDHPSDNPPEAINPTELGIVPHS